MTNVQTIVRGSADIVNIVTLSPGDVYKRVDSPTHGQPALVYGMVTDVLNDGQNAAIIAVERQSSYMGFTTERKVFTQNNELAIFPATEEEWKEHITDIIEGADRQVRDLENKLEQARETRALAEKAMSLEARSPVAVIVGRADEQTAVEA